MHAQAQYCLDNGTLPVQKNSSLFLSLHTTPDSRIYRIAKPSRSSTLLVNTDPVIDAMSALIKEVQNYNSTFNTQLATLIQLIPAVEQGDQKSIDNFKSIIQGLNENVGNFSADANKTSSLIEVTLPSVYQQMKAFSSQIDTDNAQIQSCLQSIANSKQTIAQAQMDAAQVEDEINSESWIWAPDPDEALQSLLSQHYNDEMEIGITNEMITQLNTQVGGLNSNISSLNNQISQLNTYSQTLNSMNIKCQTLVASFNNISSALNKIDVQTSGDFLKAELEAIGTDWKDKILSILGNLRKNPSVGLRLGTKRPIRFQSSLSTSQLSREIKKVGDLKTSSLLPRRKVFSPFESKLSFYDEKYTRSSVVKSRLPKYRKHIAEQSGKKIPFAFSTSSGGYGRSNLSFSNSFSSSSLLPTSSSSQLSYSSRFMTQSLPKTKVKDSTILSASLSSSLSSSDSNISTVPTISQLSGNNNSTSSSTFSSSLISSNLLASSSDFKEQKYLNNRGSSGNVSTIRTQFELPQQQADLQVPKKSPSESPSNSPRSSQSISRETKDENLSLSKLSAGSFLTSIGSGLSSSTSENSVTASASSSSTVSSSSSTSSLTQRK